MEENNSTPASVAPVAQIPQAPLVQTPLESPPPPNVATHTVSSGKPKRKILSIIIVILFILILLLAAGLFVFSRISGGAVVQLPVPTPTPTIEPKPDELGAIKNSIPQGEDTVSVAKADGQYYLKYKNKYYQSNDEGVADLKEFNLENPESYTWHGLTDITEGEVFDFVDLPEINPGFAFIMRYPLEGKDHYELYYYAYGEVASIASFDADPEKLVYRIPKFYSINSAGTLGGLHMYDCWECERHYPQTLVINFITKESQVLGPTSYFNWGTDENFEYKDYVANQDPANLPLKKGGFEF